MLFLDIRCNVAHLGPVSFLAFPHFFSVGGLVDFLHVHVVCSLFIIPLPMFSPSLGL